jgi:tetratricopeptide (TPR) repeat protein
MLGIAVSIVQAQTPQETLNQYVSDLQNNPNDNALREKIIKFVQEMKSEPIAPDDYSILKGKGAYFFKQAQNSDDYKTAVDAFSQASLKAPWKAEIYYNLGLAQEKAGLSDDAIINYKLYLLADPSANRDEILAKIGAVEAERQKALEAKQKESSPEAIAAREKQKFEDLLKKIDGRRYTYHTPYQLHIIDIQGNHLVTGLQLDGEPYTNAGSGACGRIEIKGPVCTCSYNGTAGADLDETYIISEDGTSITRRFRFTDRTGGEYIYVWQR